MTNKSVMGDLNVTQKPTFSISPTDAAVQNTTWMLQNATSVLPSADESVEFIVLGVCVIAVAVMIFLLVMVVLRYIAHQKGTYYTCEEALAFKSNPEVQDVPDSQEDPEEEEP